MKTLQIPYGSDELSLSIPDVHWGEWLAPRSSESISWTQGLQEALADPVGSVGLEAFLQGARSLLILVNDETRPTPSGRVLEFIWPRIESYPFQIMVATGVHRQSSQVGLEKIFGDLWSKIKDRILFHDCRQEGTMVFLGQTSRGTRVVVNPALMMADRLLVIGSVEPHYFAGYTGGRKAILPGVAGYSSIVANHSLAMEQASQPLVLTGNPVHDDMEEALKLLLMPPIFSLMLVLTPDHRLYSAYAGSLDETLVRASRKADEVFAVPFREKADIVVSVAQPPLDIDLYQSQKPIEHGKMALKEDGILILVMPCSQGAGPREFQELLIESGDPVKARLMLYQQYQLGFHRILRNVRFIHKGGRIWGITDLDPSFLSQTFIRPMPDLQEAVNQALDLKGPQAKIHVLLNASLCVPKQAFF
jgi:lactate racemase